MLSLLSVNNNLTPTQNLYQSSLSPFNKGLCSCLTLNDKRPDTHHLLVYNVPLSALFMLAYGVLEKKIIRHTVFQVNNPEPLHELFCYELRMPRQVCNQQAYFMQQDLATRFPLYKAHLENQLVYNLSPNMPATSEETEVLVITHANVV